MRLDNIFCFASDCILQLCDTICVSNTGVVMYEAKNLIECLLVGFCQYGVVFEVHGKKMISNEGFLKLSVDIGSNTLEI